jgi:hypothetical protein
MVRCGRFADLLFWLLVCQQCWTSCCFVALFFWRRWLMCFGVNLLGLVAWQ